MNGTWWWPDVGTRGRVRHSAAGTCEGALGTKGPSLGNPEPGCSPPDPLQAGRFCSLPGHGEPRSPVSGWFTDLAGASGCLPGKATESPRPPGRCWVFPTREGKALKTRTELGGGGHFFSPK